MRPTTAFLLMAQYDGAAVISLNEICADYFTHLTPKKFREKLNSGDIALPVVRMELSKRSALGVHLCDLAKYIDERRAAAAKELEQIQSAT